MLSHSGSSFHYSRMELSPRKLKEKAEIYGKALAALRERIRPKVTQDVAATRAGMKSQGTWARYETGGNKAFLDIDVQRQCMAALGLTLEDLEREVERVKAGDDYYAAQTDDAPAYSRETRPVNLSFPLDGTVRAGEQGFAVYESEDKEFFDFANFFDKNTRVLTVVGESMIPLLEPGSHVTYSIRGVPKRNSLAVIRLKDGQYFVKKFIRMTAETVECIEMEPFTLEGGRVGYLEKAVSYDLSKVKAVYPASVRID